LAAPLHRCVGPDAALSSEKKLERFLTDLALSKNVSASTQNQALNAIVFLYGSVLQIELGELGGHPGEQAAPRASGVEPGEHHRLSRCIGG
jgi:hypothetical protein